VDFVGYAEKRRRRRTVIVSARDYATRQGLVLFRHFWGAGNLGNHIDLWDGEGMTHGDASYFDRSREVWFWDLD
jgi:hypothetical protein